jgi:putative ABC transport system permease protein
VITIGLGIGASTAIFSVANAVLLRPLPYQDPARLVYACADLRRRHLLDFLWSSPDLADLRAHASSTIEDAAGANTFRAVYARDDGSSEEIPQANVTPNLFRVLGARVTLGRDFVESDALPQPVGPNGQPAPPDRQLPLYGIISHEFFMRRFGGNPAVLGQPVAKGGAIIVGVLAPGVELLFPPEKNVERKPDLWVAARVTPGGPRIVVQWRGCVPASPSNKRKRRPTP